MIAAHSFDAMICIPNCDTIVPGMLMGAARANLPTVFISGGPMRAGMDASGNKVDLITVFEGVGKQAAGEITDARLLELEEVACPTCGSCSGMFTANSMNCLCEALGIALPGTFEDPKAPVYVDGKLLVTLKGETIVPDFLRILDDYVERRYSDQAAALVS